MMTLHGIISLITLMILKSGEPSPMFPLARCEAMGEGGRRPGEGSLPATRSVFENFAHWKNEPSSALRAPSPTLRAGEGELEGGDSSFDALLKIPYAIALPGPGIVGLPEFMKL
jgi:hypothetical protein